MTRAIPWLCAGLHLLALAALALWLSGGTELERNILVRATYIAEHTRVWRTGWAIWMASAASLVAFYAWWAAHLPSSGLRIAGVLFAGAGMLCDLTGESMFVSVVVERAARGDFAGLQEAQRVGSLLTAGAANGLYTLGGIVLTLRSPHLPRWIRFAMWATWIAGVVMTVCSLADYVPGLVASSAVLFPLLIAWTIGTARFWRRA